MLMGDIFFAMLTSLFTAPLSSWLALPANVVGGLLTGLLSMLFGI